MTVFPRDARLSERGRPHMTENGRMRTPLLSRRRLGSSTHEGRD